MRRPEDIERELSALGRPALSLGTIIEIRASLLRAKQWDAAHPTEANRYAALVAELEEANRHANALETERLAQERAQRRLGQRLETAGLGDRQRAAAEKPEHTEALEAAKAWWGGETGWLLLLGPTRIGKSVAAAWCVLEALRSGKSAAQRKAQELVRLSGFDAGAAELERLKHLDLLVVDDCGAEHTNEWGRAVLFELLDARHESPGRTVLTSNLRPKELRAHLGERISDRIAENCVVRALAGRQLKRAGQSVGEGR